MQAGSDYEPAERAGSPLKRKIAAIMAADVAGYSRLVAADEERTLRDLAAAREIFDAFVRRSGGRIFNTAGDSVMSEFDSAVEAVRVAVDIQNTLRAQSAGVSADRRLEFRIGITIGDVVERDGDLLGDGVNIAARLEGLAPVGGICVSRSVHEAVANKIAVAFQETGPRKVKNIPQPIHAYVIPAPVDPPTSDPLGVTVEPGERRLPSSRARAAGRMAPPFAVGLVCGALALAASGAWTMRGTIMKMMPATTTSQADLQRSDLQRSDLQRSELKSEARPGDARSPASRGGLSNNTSAVADLPPTMTPPPTATPRATEPATVAKPASTARAPVRSVGPGPAAPPPPAPTIAPDKLASAAPDVVKTEAAKPDAAKPDGARPDAAKPESPPARVVVPADPALAFANLAKDGLVAEPKTLSEFYHNARLLEARGDRAGALKAYAALAPSAGDLVDPLMRYAALLRGRGGSVEAARQTFAELARSATARAAALVAADLSAPTERRAALEDYVAANPDMVPASQLLADDYLSRAGGPTLTERRLAFDQLDAFLDAESRARFFVDRTMLDSWVDAARRRRTEIEAFFDGAAARPRAEFARSEAGWSARVTLPEPATSVSYRVGEQGDFAAIGAEAGADSRGGRTSQTFTVTLPAGSARTTLYVTYRDLSGRDAGPFPLPFDPALAIVSAERDTLERYPESWVSFRPDLPDLLSYAQLISNRCAIARALIGFGNEPPRQPLALPACNAGGPNGASPDSRAVLALPAGTDSVQMQIAYSDGTESPVRIFRRP